MQINIIVNFTYEAIHKWEDCKYESVSFLKNTHRHLFYITCKKPVKSYDREIEIIKLKRKISNYLKIEYNNDFQNMSCEEIAIIILRKFKLNYCRVLEDNENGAEVYEDI